MMRSRTPGGFSLIELLVTLSIITLLVALLLSTLHRVRNSARAGACASNIRQIALANHVYANDHRSQLCPGAADFKANLNRWFGSRESVSDSFKPDNGPLSDYLGPGGMVRNCPAFSADYTHDNNPMAFESGCGGYGYNNAYLGVKDDQTTDEAGVRMSAIGQPARTIMFSDAAFAISTPSPGLIEYSFAEPPQIRGYPQFDLIASLHFRHGGRANVSWADGSVQALKFGATRSNSIYGLSESQMRDFGLGWPSLSSSSTDELNNDLFDLE